jgi:hypothetical protein
MSGQGEEHVACRQTCVETGGFVVCSLLAQTFSHDKRRGFSCAVLDQEMTNLHPPPTHSPIRAKRSLASGSKIWSSMNCLRSSISACCVWKGENESEERWIIE